MFKLLQHPVTAGNPKSLVCALLDAGQLLHYAEIGVCDCRACQYTKERSTTGFAQIARKVYEARFKAPGKLLRSMMEDWDLEQFCQEFSIDPALVKK